jgi:hypothetical protein
MRVPWRFLIGLVLGGAAAIAFFVGAIYSQLGVPTASSQWIADVTREQLRLAGQSPGPRLLVVSGSSGLFGINAAEIERATGYPTFNFGTHAALSLGYRLDRLKQSVRPGDIILFAWEYEHYTGEDGSPEIESDYVIARDPAYFSDLPLARQIAWATRLPLKRLQKGWSNERHPEKVRPPSPPYSPYPPITAGIDCLDDHGDEVFNTAAQQKLDVPFTGTGVLVNGLSPDAARSFDQLARFIGWAHERHITVLATFPAVLWDPRYETPVADATVRRISDFYASHGVPVVGTAQEAMLPSRRDFLDTFYHLTHDAAMRRTGQLIPELRPYLPGAR